MLCAPYKHGCQEEELEKSFYVCLSVCLSLCVLVGGEICDTFRLSCSVSLLVCVCLFNVDLKPFWVCSCSYMD